MANTFVIQECEFAAKKIITILSKNLSCKKKALYQTTLNYLRFILAKSNLDFLNYLHEPFDIGNTVHKFVSNIRMWLIISRKANLSTKENVFGLFYSFKY